MVDEAHGTGAIGPEGRGAVAAAGLEDEVDVVVGTLGKALGSYGAYVCCGKSMSQYLVNTARTFIFSTAPAPPSVAGAMAALELLREQPRRVEKLQRNAAVLREALAEQGLGSRARRHPDPAACWWALPTTRWPPASTRCDMGSSPRRSARPPCAEGTSRLRLTVMASHTKSELRDAAKTIAAAVGETRTAARARVFDGLAEAA